MDWSRAKTILIWAFLFLDLFLGYQVYASRTQQWMDTDAVAGGTREIEAFLAQHNIVLQAEIPQQTPDMNYLNVEYSGFQAMVPKEMPGQQVTMEKTAVSVRFTQPIPVLQKNPAELLRLISQRVVSADQYQPDLHLSGRERLVFWQMHERVPLFVAPLEVYLKNGTAVGFHQTYVHIRNQGSGRQVISAATALRSLVEKEVIQPGERIEDVSLGYYGHTYDADIQVLAPVWRFIHNGEVHYVNGFTGAVEKATDY